ncbi:ATP-dependent helicase HrpB [Oricola cellulosilytica]|uniref:ATP-dependent helicase HrpB n=1 Tax=Oricola cellulosilytica TaxID=1429082 RepID=A0A4R0PHN5_9HYPH|nr:ATP-dependent helicase HrpB [Oricola cellulosilytica]TCD16294.1 ATP-dependent helicase HrpB [Oricola cellulosilytica]
MTEFRLPGLPVTAVLPEMRAALSGGRNAVLVAPPGAGKTTLVPLALLDAAWLNGKKIILLEPRRLAAGAAARRMAELLGEEVGETVGYRMRLDTRVGPSTRIEVVTEGVFQRIVTGDPELAGIGAVLFDEFHERSLDADFALALTLDVQAGLRDDLRIVVMSATLDGARVSCLLGGPPVIESRGRAFPVEMRYEERTGNEPVESAVARAIRRTLATEDGSLLVFLPGQAEIYRAAKALETGLPEDVFVAPLYGMMEIADQDRAIKPPPAGTRKVVLATALAETSVTIDGVRVVIDGGLARRPVFDPASGLTRLETGRVSQAAATQRAGRAGRTAPGVAIRLWREEQTRALAAFDPPEILNADLSSLLLDCLEWGVADPASLRFLDPPPAPALSEARELLFTLGATGPDGSLTGKGRIMREIGLGARLAAMVADATSAGDAFRRMALGLLISERGVGGGGLDLAYRLERMLTQKGGRAARLRATAKRSVASVMFGVESTGGPASAGAMLISAFPDRIARARSGGRPGRFVMANGRGVYVDEADRLASEDFLVVAEVTGKAHEGRVSAAAPITLGEIRETLADRIEVIDQIGFDKVRGGLFAKRIERFGSVTLSSSNVPVEPGEAAVEALLAGIRRHGLEILPWSETSKRLLERLRWLRASLGAPWREMDEGSLLDTLEDWLSPYLEGAVALNQLRGGVLQDALIARLPYDLSRKLNELAPQHYIAPTGTRVELDYPADGTSPAIAIRVQELFGLTSHPSIGDGIPLTIELLSPARRPIQRTRDLPGFWSGSWASVRADLRGRYPKHPWPEDPASAAATRTAKTRR